MNSIKTNDNYNNAYAFLFFCIAGFCVIPSIISSIPGANIYINSVSFTAMSIIAILFFIAGLGIKLNNKIAGLYLGSALLVFGVIAQLSYLITDGVTSSITNLIVAACLAIVLLKLIRENTTSNTIIREDLLEPTQEDISEKAVANKS